MELSKHRDREGALIQARDKADESYGRRNRVGRILPPTRAILEGLVSNCMEKTRSK